MTAPTRFGRYEVRRVLGRGGMGVVYAGQDPQIDRPVAIKTITLDALNADEAAQFEARFRAEMRSTGRLLHQNIVALYDAGRDDGAAYIVMELVPGQDLKRRLAQRCSNAATTIDADTYFAQARWQLERPLLLRRDPRPACVRRQRRAVLGAAGGRDPAQPHQGLPVVLTGPGWTRGSKTYVEWAAGSIDARGRFSAEGEDKEETGTRKNHWLLRASGGYNAKVQPPRLDGDVELLRSKDRSLARRCTFSAVRR